MAAPARTEITTPAARPNPRRATLEATAEPEKGNEPSLPRFFGKLVAAGGKPLVDTKVELYRWSPDVAINRDQAYLVTEPPRGPQFLAAHTQTDDLGGFVLEGDWPRSLFMLRAGSLAIGKSQGESKNAK